MPRPVIDELLKEYFFYFWDEAIHEIRFVTSFDTTEEDIEAIAAIGKKCFSEIYKSSWTFTGWELTSKLSPLGGRGRFTENKPIEYLP